MVTVVLRRHPAITVRKAENTFVERAVGKSREIVFQYFELLQFVLNVNDLFDKRGHISNTGETGDN